jgi:transposase
LRLLKKIPQEIEKHIKENKIFSTINLYFQDESRFGLFTRNGKMITAKGVQSICNYHHEFKNMYLFGAFSPITGDTFLLELPECNTDMFQLYLNHFAEQKPDELKIVFLDNGAFHKAKRLIIPTNIILVFIPPYSPELNPAELVWKFLKARIINKTCKTLKDLSKEIEAIVKQKLSAERIMSITNYKIYTNNFKTSYDL